MTVQQTRAPIRRRTAAIAVTLVVTALVVGSVTAVNLFPTQANERSLAEPARPVFAVPVADTAPSAGRDAVLEAFRAQERADPAQAADRERILERFRAQERGEAATSARAQEAWSDRLEAQARSGRAQQAWSDRLEAQVMAAGQAEARMWRAWADRLNGLAEVYALGR